MRTTTTDDCLLADAAHVLAARSALDPLLDRLASAPLDHSAVEGLRAWLDESYPCAAAAPDRLEASSAAASPSSPQSSRRLSLVGSKTRRPDGNEDDHGTHRTVLSNRASPSSPTSCCRSPTSNLPARPLLAIRTSDA